MIIQLKPQIPVRANGRDAQALGWIDYSEEADLLWICAFDDNGEIWIVPNKEIRMFKNYSLGRNLVNEPKN